MGNCEHVLNLYGIVDSQQRLPVSDLARLEVIAVADLAAVVEEVPEREFAAEVLEHRFQDLGWVALVARKHEHLVEAVMECGSVIPAPLCTLFSSGEAVRDLLIANREKYQTLLARLRNRREWGLKVHCRAEALPDLLAPSDPTAQALEHALLTASPGRAYVLRKQLERRMDELVSQRIDDVVDEVLHALDAVAVDRRLRPAQQPASDEAAMILNAAILVDAGAAAEVHAVGARLASRFGDEGFVLELTGPWPAYSFCDDAGVRGAGPMCEEG
jgi:Gas vesicle synthesis protein GvpL/GvpF